MILAYTIQAEPLDSAVPTEYGHRLSNPSSRFRACLPRSVKINETNLG